MKYKGIAKSYNGWFVVSAIERFERLDEDQSNPNRRCTAWENTHLVRADNVEHAYDKITQYYEGVKSKEITELRGKKGTWVFEGITDLVPICEELEDLSEILWADHRNISVKSVKNRTYTKQELLSHYMEPDSDN